MPYEHNPDPQIAGSIIQARATIFAALLGGLAAAWTYVRSFRKQDPRCMRICENMVGVAETLITVIRFIGADHPMLSAELTKAEHKITEARAWLNEESLR